MHPSNFASSPAPASPLYQPRPLWPRLVSRPLLPVHPVPRVFLLPPVCSVESFHQNGLRFKNQASLRSPRCSSTFPGRLGRDGGNFVTGGRGSCRAPPPPRKAASHSAGRYGHRRTLPQDRAALKHFLPRLPPAAAAAAARSLLLCCCPGILKYKETGHLGQLLERAGLPDAAGPAGLIQVQATFSLSLPAPAPTPTFPFPGAGTYSLGFSLLSFLFVFLLLHLSCGLSLRLRSQVWSGLVAPSLFGLPNHPPQMQKALGTFHPSD